jgi:hypothetical protein
MLSTIADTLSRLTEQVAMLAESGASEVKSEKAVKV